MSAMDKKNIVVSGICVGLIVLGLVAVGVVGYCVVHGGAVAVCKAMVWLYSKGV